MHGRLLELESGSTFKVIRDLQLTCKNMDSLEKLNIALQGLEKTLKESKVVGGMVQRSDRSSAHLMELCTLLVSRNSTKFPCQMPHAEAVHSLLQDLLRHMPSMTMGHSSLCRIQAWPPGPIPVSQGHSTGSQPFQHLTGFSWLPTSCLLQESMPHLGTDVVSHHQGECPSLSFLPLKLQTELTF